ncbi:MAG: response regulator transcription factor [Flavobacteriaceae bacterium]|nr:response regulator transcription factor [Flavobacteriaceae bacterium]
MLNAITIDDDKLVNKALEVFLERSEDVNYVASFLSPIDAVRTIKEKDIHLIFLDVEFPEISGIDFLNSIPNYCQVVLMSSKKDYAVEAFDFDVTDFIHKPITLARLIKSIEKVKANIQNDLSIKDKKFIFIKEKSQLVRIDLSEVYVIQALGDYVTFQSANKKYIVHSSMKSIEAKIPEDDFIRIHRSYIINLEHVKSMEDSTLAVGDKVVPISKSYRSKLLSRLNIA